MIGATYTPPNLGDLSATPAYYHKCGPRCSDTFAVVPTRIDVLVNPAEEDEGQIDDLIVKDYSSEGTRTDYHVFAEQQSVVEADKKEVTITSTNQSVLLAPDENGVCEAVATGKSVLIARASDGEVSAREVDVTVTDATSGSRWTGYAPDSLAAHCNSQIETLTAGKTTASMDLWSIRNNSAASYEWNDNCWGAGLANKGCMSPYNTYTGAGGGGALITPRHAVFCHHLGYYPRVGSRIRYVTNDNRTEEVVVEALLPHPYTAGWVIAAQDIVICKFDRDVSVPFAKVLPPDPSGYLPSINVNTGERYAPQVRPTSLNIGRPYVRACHTSQTKKLATSAIVMLPDTTTPYQQPGNPQLGDETGSVTHETGAANWRLSDIGNPLGQVLTTGASGAPAFLVINNELVVTNVWSSPTGGYGFYTDASIINGMIDDMGNPDNYTLTEVDLTEFPTY